MAATAPPPAPRINPTRPEHLAGSNKRQSKHQILQLYQQLLPLPPAAPTLLNTFLSALPFSALDTPHIQAEWDDLTQSVWVTDEQHMLRLWRQGFFGKGFLSRSEPSWRRRVENRRAEVDGRQKRLTSEEITAQRRLERKGTKLVKKLERDAERLVAASTYTSVAGSAPSSPALTPSSLPTLGEELEAGLEKVVEEREGEEKEADEDEEEEQDPVPEPWQLGAEHTQLQPEEAFFLLFSLGCLRLTLPSSPSSSSPSAPSPPLSILAAFRLFLLSAAPSLPSPPPTLPDPRLSRLDSPFLLSYAAYHHYRSMGWVVRSGVKFCTDWVLYGQGGPVGGHAEFAVVILPSYDCPSDALSSPFRSHSALAIDRDLPLSAFASGDADADAEGYEHLLGEGERKNSWRWFHTVNRVCSGVKKTLVLLHVRIPPLSSLPQGDPEWVATHPAQALAKLEMREVVVRRFLAGRMRD
ncbi:hypothetical protein JCM8097_007398 [Rhodosporidiobolus ruineniae]